MKDIIPAGWIIARKYRRKWQILCWAYGASRKEAIERYNFNSGQRSYQVLKKQIPMKCIRLFALKADFVVLKND